MYRIIASLSDAFAKWSNNRPAAPETVPVPDLPGPTIKDMIANFRKTYALKGNYSIDEVRHDALHVMAGLGVGGVNELRIDAIIMALQGKSLIDACRSIHDSTFLIRDAMKKSDDTQVATPFSQLETKKALDAQKHMQALTKEEVQSLFEIGLQIGKQFEHYFGQKYFDVPKEHIEALPFTLFDFSHEVLAARLAHERPKNRRVERMARNLMEQESLARDGESHIPHHDKSWVDTFKPK